MHDELVEDLVTAAPVSDAAPDAPVAAVDADVVRAVTPAGIQHRTMALSASTPVAGDDRIPVALSSEFPVHRDFGIEILGHAPGEVDLSRAVMGGVPLGTPVLPLLLYHDTSNQVGVVEDIRLDADAVLRGMLRFSSAPAAQQVKQDMLDGIRLWVSVGYQLLDLALVSRTPHDTYRATRWQPTELSVVPCPADITVGIHRSLSDMTQDAPQDARPSTTQARTIIAVSTPQKAPSAPEHHTRMNPETAAEIVRMAQENGVADKAADFLGRGLTVDAVAREILALRSVAAPAVRGQAGVDLAPKDAGRYSMSRAIARQIDGKLDGLEGEVHAELAKQLGRSTTGVFVPTSMQRSDFTATGNAAVTVQNTVGDLIELLRNKSAFLGNGVTMLSGLQGNLSLPKATGTVAAQWAGEAPAAPYAKSGVSFAQIGLTPKTLAAFTSFSRQALVQSSVSVEAYLRGEIARQLALAVDMALVNGDGVTAPRGIKNTTGVHVLTQAAAKLGYADFVALETEVEDSNIDVSTAAFIINPRTKGAMRVTSQMGNQIALPVYQNGEIAGTKAITSKQVGDSVIYGDQASLILAEWGAVELLMDPYSNATQGLINLVATMFADSACRHGEAFSMIETAAL